MTREEAIEEIQESLDTLREYDITHSSRLKQALEMAIQALSQEPCDDAISREAVIMECIKYADHEHNVQLKKEVSETRKHDAQVIIYACDYFKTFVEKLPSVTQKPETVTEFAERCRECGARYGKLLKQKSGKWIKVKSGDKDFPESIVCSRCSNENSHLDFNENAEPIGKVFVTSKFCPNCGARMESEDKE